MTVKVENDSLIELFHKVCNGENVEARENKVAFIRQIPQRIRANKEK